MRIIIFLLATIFVTSILSAQDCDLMFNLDESGSQSHIARNSITLDNNYSYSPNGGTLTIEIQNPVVAGNVNYEPGIDPETRTLNTSLPVGAIPGNFSVDQMGGASYTIPIKMPPGVNGLSPQLSINYSSNSGPGIAGYGWQIGGLSAISRGAQSYFYDGKYTGLGMDTTDRFYIDGQRLINTISSYKSYSTVKYRTDNDIFTRVTPKDINTTYGPTWFNAEAKSGLIYEYGHNFDSKQFINGYNQVLNWYLSKVSDRFGNQINYAYLKDSYNIYPAEITYGPNTITFFYKERTDKKSDFLKGTNIWQQYILDKITIKYNNIIITTYEFKYALEGNSYTSQSLLNEVIEYGIGSERVNSTVISYEKPDDILITQTTNNSTSMVDYQVNVIPGDYNGDGKTDIACLPIPGNGATWTGMKVLYSDGMDGFTNASYLQATYIPKYLDDIRALDINGDGKQDLVYERKVSASSAYEYYYMLSNGNSFSNPVGFQSSSWDNDHGLIGKYQRYSRSKSDDNQVTGEDYNGDGLNDIFLNDKYGNWEISSLGNSSGKLTSSMNCFAYGTNSDMKDRIISGDFNGDGKTDIWCFQSAGMKIYTWDGSDLVLLYTASTPTSNHILNLGDFNADGKSDLFIYGTTGSDYDRWLIYLSNGTGFELNGVPSKKDNLKSDIIRLGDFNGDDATDIMVTSSNNSWQGAKFYISKNNGTDLQAYELSNLVPTNRFYLGDFNGDAKCDFFCTDGTSPWWRSYQMYKTTGKTNFLVNKIGDGLGNNIEISYTKLSQANYSIYNIGSGAVFPVYDYQGPITVVYRTEFDNGIGGTRSISNYYEGLKIHQQGKGFLGYSKSRTVGFITTENTYTYNTTYFTPSVTTSSKMRNGYTSAFETTTNTWSQIVFSQSKKWITSYVQSTQQNNTLTGQVVNIVNTFDNYGNPTNITKSINGDVRQVVNNTYTNTESSWLLGQATSSSVQNINNEGSVTKTIQRTYDPSSNHLVSETSYAQTDKELVHSYVYNTNGTLQSESLTSNGISRSTNYTYENNGIRTLTVTDPLSHTMTNTYDLYGRLATQQDYLNNTVTYGYDNMHRQTSVSKSDGSSTTTIYSWEDPTGTVLNARYAVQNNGNNGAQTKTWYDKLGRALRNDVIGFDGNMVFTSIEYNYKGQLLRQSEPYNSSQTPVWNTFSYDLYGRKYNLTTPSGRNSTWQYTAGTGIITEISGGKTYAKEFAPDGSLKSATDAGGTINYTYYPDGLVKSITAPGNIVTTMQYDVAGNKTQLTDPSAGTLNYTYNGFGELLTSENGENETTSFTYFPDGRIQQKLSPEGTTTYTYNTNKLLEDITTPDNINRTYDYEENGRISEIHETIDGITYSTGFNYDNKGRISTITHPSDIVETNSYNNFGYLASVSAGGVVQWTTLAVNSRGQVTSGRYGATLNTTNAYDNYGFPVSQITGSLQNMQYQFNPITGNLNQRSNGLLPNLQENFDYDALDRLDRIYNGSNTILDLTYSVSNLTGKTDLGTMEFLESGKPNRLTGINLSTGLVPNTAQSIDYTSFESVNNISENGYSADFYYNANNNRAKMVVSQNGNAILSRIYASNRYIKETAGGITKEYTFIGGDAYTAPAVAVKQNGTTVYYFLLRDHLGSITQVVNASTNAKVAEYSFDAWGRMRNTTTWANYAPGSEPALMIAGRGYTGHEHLPWFNLINMNSRLYDPLTAQFLSPDKYVLDPTFSPSYNRYSYCLYNPLKYVDLTGNKYDPTHMDYGDDYLPANNLSKSGITTTIPISFSGFMGYGSYLDAMSQGYKGSYNTFIKDYGDQILNLSLGCSNPDATLSIKYIVSWTFSSDIINNENVVTAYVVYGYKKIKVGSDINPSSQGGKNSSSRKLDPSRISYTFKPGSVTLRNKDPYTKDWSIKSPDQVAIIIKELYRLKYGSDLNIETESLAIEIWAHAILFDNGILTTKTDNANCGDDVNSEDGNRWIWDTWWRMTVEPVYVPY